MVVAAEEATDARMAPDGVEIEQTFDQAIVPAMQRSAIEFGNSSTDDWQGRKVGQTLNIVELEPGERIDRVP